MDFSAGAVVFEQGDPGDSFYLVESGEVAITQGKVHLATLGPRDYFGELALLEDDVRKATATATTDSVLLRIAKKTFEQDVLADETFEQVVSEFRDWSKLTPEEEEARKSSWSRVNTAACGRLLPLSRVAHTDAAVLQAREELVPVWSQLPDGDRSALVRHGKDMLVELLRAQGGVCSIGEMHELACECGWPQALAKQSWAKLKQVVPKALSQLRAAVRLADRRLRSRDREPRLSGVDAQQPCHETVDQRSDR